MERIIWLIKTKYLEETTEYDGLQKKPWLRFLMKMRKLNQEQVDHIVAKAFVAAPAWYLVRMQLKLVGGLKIRQTKIYLLEHVVDTCGLTAGVIGR